MSSSSISSGSTPPREPEYVWEIAKLFPEQGAWTDSEYLELTDRSKQRVEFTDGRVEFLPMPTEIHEALVRFLFLRMYSFVDEHGYGEVYSNGIRVQIRPGKIRLPDIVFLHHDHFHLRHNRVWHGADLVMEVVSDDPKDRERDYEQKREDYAEANVAEYWIVDPIERKIVIQSLHNGRYHVNAEYSEGSRAASVLLGGFELDVSALFGEMDKIPK